MVMALDMQRARSQMDVDVAIVRDFLYGNREKWEEHSELVKIMCEDPTFDKSQRLYMSRSGRYNNGLRMMNRIHELQDEYGWSSHQMTKAASLMDEPTGFHLHLVAFEPVMRSQASPKLLARYEALVRNRGILGCYLQTELAHGSNVSSLETTAAYLPQTKEFEINSPTPTSSKWWVGGAAKTATHGVVQAKLILPNGRDVGPHLFFVQLRSLEDHHVLPGITLGEIGPKAMNGNTAVDNGFARFDHVKIPAENMLSKFSQVTEDGRYIRPPHAKISYGGMLYIRSSMVSSGGWTVAKAVTVAIRYATVRRQGNQDSGGLERQIITYPSVYNRLLPILARSYIFILLGRSLEKAFAEMTERLSNGDTTLLAEMHATTSGLKVLVSTSCAQDIETARRALGGHGYSAYSGLGRLYADYVPAATYEGDNFVLDLQVVRAALKAYSRFVSAEKPSICNLSPSTQYLHLLLEPVVETTAFSWQDPGCCVHLLERRAVSLLRDLVLHDSDRDASVEERVSRAVTEAFVAEQIMAYIGDIQNGLPEKSAEVLRDLLHLYLLTTVEVSLADLLSFHLLPLSGAHGTDISGDASRELRKAIQRLCLKLLPQTIGLTDAFGFTDWELDSALGVFDGNVYETLWEKVQTEPLNKSEVPDGYKEYIKPVLLRGQRMTAKYGAKL